MSDLAVRVEDLGKRYRIGERAHHRNVREAFGRMLAAPYARLRRRQRKAASNHHEANTFWALRHVSFELKQGELMGIVGRNGAGKSTLLKILSRITEPTEGTADIRGRVRTLLEVGTGFHPELTGRENIYLNGAILGMKRAEIARNFDEIVAFAEVERFIDTPVKWYSSGMYTRLAFSVAAHLEPDVLIVDEVLSVGDIGFRRKCLGKMQEVGALGRTVFFVSHVMPAVAQLCNRVMLLDGGRVVRDGPASEVLAEYEQLATGSFGDRYWTDLENAPGSDIVRLRAVRVVLDSGQVTTRVDRRDSVGIEMQYDALTPALMVQPSCSFFNSKGLCLFTSTNPNPSTRPAEVGRYTTTCWIPGELLAEGVVKVTARITTPSLSIVHVHERDVVAFDVMDGSADGSIGPPNRMYPGVVRPRLEWTTDMLDLENDAELQGAPVGVPAD
jgi:lipopolysaccharide transport system ATP-binding protein